MRSFLYLSLILILLIIVPAQVSWAGLELGTDLNDLDFGFMVLGETKELARYGSYHNELICSSTNGRTWYLKIHDLSPLSYADQTIANPHFKWLAVWTNGGGEIINQHRFNEFSTSPSLVYISGSDDNMGTEVRIQFKYRLHIPKNQAAGSYNTIIRYTMSETL